MAGVVFVEDGSQKRCVQALASLAARTGDVRPVLEAARGILTEDEATVFDSSGSTIGERWDSLSPDTALRKGSDRLLVMTGALRAALTNPENVHIVGSQASLNASSVPYAHFHISGTSSMPARPFLGLSATAQRSLSALMRRYLHTE